MKLLFDHNLPPGLVTGLRNLSQTPNTFLQLVLIGQAIWKFANTRDAKALSELRRMQISVICAFLRIKIHEKEVPSMRLTEMVSCSG